MLNFCFHRFKSPPLSGEFYYLTSNDITHWYMQIHWLLLLPKLGGCIHISSTCLSNEYNSLSQKASNQFCVSTLLYCQVCPNLANKSLFSIYVQTYAHTRIISTTFFSLSLHSYICCNALANNRIFKTHCAINNTSNSQYVYFSKLCNITKIASIFHITDLPFGETTYNQPPHKNYC